MIKYNGGSYGFSILLRVHGSAVYKSFFPCLMSSVIYLVLFKSVDLQDGGTVYFLHPYPMGALISALTFLLAFRANFSYNRYSESMTSVHVMHSKWLDAGMELAAFHLQAAVYEKRRPPAFGNHPEINSLERARERLNEPTLEELEDQLDGLEEEIQEQDMTASSTISTMIRRKKGRVLTLPDFVRRSKPKPKPKHPLTTKVLTKSINAVQTTYIPNASMHRFFSMRGNANTGKAATMPDNAKVQASNGSHRQVWDPDKPPLFLQEAAHLLSLLSAVAFSTLRNDLEQAASPLITFTPGVAFPHVDPDAYTADVRKDWSPTSSRPFVILRYIFGWSRTAKDRTLYNAARPFRVIGGVSDAEIELLQAARGPLAKVALVSMWFQEFITREYLAGSNGNVPSPCVSRLYQFISDGMLGYNQARKVAYVPFPFAHAQITALFVFVVVGLMPCMMLSFVSNEFFGFVLNLVTVMCFAGLHEVARELESPFQNVPNDVPLNNFQGQFNEALMTMFYGFHPDAYWQVVIQKERAVVVDCGPPRCLEESEQSENLDVEVSLVESDDAK